MAVDNPTPLIKQLSDLEKKNAKDVATLMDFAYTVKGKYE
jgi:hypothetical protein